MSTAVTDVLDLDIHGLAIEVWPEVERIVKMRFPVDTDLTDGWTFTVPHPIAGDAYELTGEIGESDEDTPRPQVTFTMPADRMRDIMRQRFVIALDGVPKISGPIRVANVQSLAGETTVSVTLVEPQAIDVTLTVVDGEATSDPLSAFDLPFPSFGTMPGAWQGHPSWSTSGPTVEGDWTNQDPNAFAVPFTGIPPLAPLTLWGNGFTALLTGNLLGLFVEGTAPDPTQPIATVPAWARPGGDWTLEDCNAFRVRWVSQDETAPYAYHVLRTDENVIGRMSDTGVVTIPGGWPVAPPEGATTVLLDFGVVVWFPYGSNGAMPVGFALRAKVDSYTGDGPVTADAGTILCLAGCEQLVLDDSAISYQEGAAVVVVTTEAAVALSAGSGTQITGIDGTSFTSREVPAGTRVLLQYAGGVWTVLVDSSAAGDVPGGGSTVAAVVLFLAVATTDGTNTSWDVLTPDAAAEADGLVPAGWASTVHLDMGGADFIAVAAPDADPDTVFTVLVPAGDAVGVWQFTPATIEDPWTQVDVSLAYCTAPKWFGAATDAGPWVTLADPDGVATALTDAIGDLPTRLFAAGPSLGDRWAIVGKPNGENSWFTTPTWGSINTGNGWDTRAKLTILAPQPGVAPGDYWFAEWCTRERQAAGEWGSDQDDNEDAVYGADGRLGLFVEDCLTETPAETEAGEDAAGRLYSLPPEALDLDYYDPTFQFTYGDVITVRKTYLFDDGNGNRVKTLWREVALADAEDTTADGRSWKRVVQNTIPGVGSIADSDQPWAIALSTNATFAIAWMEGRVGIDGTLVLHFDADDAQADGTVVSSLVTHDYGAGVAPQTWTPNAAPGSPVAPIFVDTTLEEWAAESAAVNRVTPAVFGMVNSDGGAVTGREGAIRVGDNGTFALPTLTEADHGTPLWFFVRSTGATLDSVFVDGTGVVTDYPLTDGSTVLLRYYGYGDGYWDLVLDSSAGGGGGLDEAAVQALIDATTGALTATDVGADLAGTAAALVDDLSGVSNAATARTNLGLGTAATTAATDYATAGHNHTGTYQPLDSDLTSIAALTTTPFGRALLELADAAAARTALGTAYGTATGTVAEGISIASATWRTGNYYGAAIPIANAGNAMASGTVRAVPFFNPVAGRTIDQLAIDVFSASGTPAAILYICTDSNGYPGTVVASGSVTPAATSRQTASVSYTLPRGLLWLVAHSTAATWAGLTMAGPTPYLPVNPTYSANPMSCWQVTGAGTSLLTAFPAGGTQSANGMQILLRAA